MDAVPKPTIGRVVHFNHDGNRKAAIVTHVYGEVPKGHDDDLLVADASMRVSLEVLGVGEFTSVEYAEEPAESAAKLNKMTTPLRTWSWPPRTA